MPKTKILVLTDDMPWGHRSIAKAIFNFLKRKENSAKQNDIEVEYAEVKQTFTILDDLYTFLYRYFPLSNKMTIKFLENDKAREMFLEITKSNEVSLRNVVKKHKPDLIICSYCFHSHSLVKLREDTGLKFELWTVVADPWTSSRLNFVDGADLNLVYDDVAYKQALNYGFDEKNILKTGWWVREEMYDKRWQISDVRSQVRKKLGFVDDRPVVFVGGGSLGTSSLLKLLPVLMMVKTKVGLIFNTGTDKLAYNMVEEYIKLFKKLRRTDLVQIKNMGWIENMGEVLSASDIVFGKAGPNFLFDVVAAGKPFVSITHIGGQEDGNIDIIKKKKLGWVKEEGNLAAEFLIEYLKNPGKYNNKYKNTIAIEALSNQQAMEKIYRRIKKDLI